MGKQLTREFHFRSGAIRFRDLGYVIASNKKLDADEVPNSVVFSWDRGTWGATTPLEWSPAASCVASKPKSHFVAVGGDDSFVIVGQGDFVEGHLHGQLEKDRSGIVRSVRDIEGWAYAVGFGGVVLKRSGVASWVRVDAGIPPSVRFEAIHGFNESDIYAVGWEGHVWHFSGKTWSRCTVPTNAILSAVCCAGDSFVYIAGQNGTILRGRTDKWAIVPNDAENAHIWDLEWFNGKLYASTYVMIYEVGANGVIAVEFGPAQPDSAYHLSSADAVLWSVGESDVATFDGKKWALLLTTT